jgi:hypothetical protein
VKERECSVTLCPVMELKLLRQAGTVYLLLRCVVLMPPSVIANGCYINTARGFVHTCDLQMNSPSV